MQNHNGNAVRIAALLDVNAVTVANIQHLLIKRINRFVKMGAWALLSYDFIHNHPISRVERTDHDAER